MGAIGGSGFNPYRDYPKPPKVILKKVKEVPPGAVMCMAPDGQKYYAPPDIIIYPKDGYLTIMGVGANADPKKGLTGISPVIKGIKLDQSKPKEGAKIFERSLCRVSKPFNIGFGV